MYTDDENDNIAYEYCAKKLQGISSVTQIYSDIIMLV